MPTDTKKVETRYEVGGQELTAEQAVALLKRYKRALEGLTVGGSEFVNDPERCLAHIKNRQEAAERIARKLGYSSALEAAAGVATQYQEPHPDGVWEAAFNSACRSIAAAILALKEKE